MLTGNKGEWSEIYVLLKLLADGHLYAGDSRISKIEGLVFPIIKILRDSTNGSLEFLYDSNIVIIHSDKEVFRIPVSQFHLNSKLLLSKIKEAKTSSFSISEIENFINTFNCNSIKAKSSVKSDIRIIIHDQQTGTNPELGFSIKSQLGGASTLLNASKNTTNFVYKIENIQINDKDLNEINSINTKNKIRDRISHIIKTSGKLKFHSTESIIFGNNLTLIDSSLPNILAEIIFSYYTSSNSSMFELVNEISKLNPLNYNNSYKHPFYEYKIKRFLTDVALGMMPAKVWNGQYDTTGGYLIVKDDGEILCYHIYNRNEFEEYLIMNTKLETPSSNRHDFGYIYSNNGIYYIKLNLQIRFLK